MEVSDRIDDELLRAGNDELTAGNWSAARECFERALARSEAPEALEGLGWTAWWLADADLVFDARERAYRAYRERGDDVAAGRIATWLAADFREFRGEIALARGWLERAHRLLDDKPEGAEHGWLALTDADFALNLDEDREACLEAAARAATLGRRLGSPDLEAVGLALEGVAMVGSGQLEEGMRRLDEASAIAVGERIEAPLASAWTLCCVVSASESIGDFARAAEWCTVMRRFAERWGGRQIMGMCRTSYGRVLATRGEWSEAEDELTAAVEDFNASRPGMAAGGLVRLAELRARQGRAEEARKLFERAGPAGLIGLGNLALASGDAVEAVELAERVLRRLPDSSLLDRLPALELLARARAARGEAEAARQAVAAVERAAAHYSTPYLRARALVAAADVARGADDHELARQRYEDAIDCFEEGAAPYDAALARLGLAEALLELGRAEHAAAAADAARATFERLGATRDSERAAELIARTAPTDGAAGGLGELTARELEVLRLVAKGMSDSEIAEELIVSPHTVHRHIANVRTKLNLPSRAAAVAYAARHGLL
ncbi:MAG TPA: LuxR C-terminal-related transcriptional regulator [Solirubrobacterales bacterium]